MIRCEQSPVRQELLVVVFLSNCVAFVVLTHVCTSTQAESAPSWPTHRRRPAEAREFMSKQHNFRFSASHDA